MHCSITFTETDYNSLTDFLFSDRKQERAAYLLCNLSEAPEEIRFLVKECITVSEEELNHASQHEMSIKSISYVRAIKKAKMNNQAFILVHSHPHGILFHSAQDDRQEKPLFNTIFQRISDHKYHASLVLSDPDKPVAKMWKEDGTNVNVDLIRVVGQRLKFYPHPKSSLSYPDFFDRQVRAFGGEVQALLKNMTIGIVGTGGTGSAVAEQLIRLGVGTLCIFDGESFEKTNVNRVYGSRLTDEGKKKIEIIQRLAKNIGLGTIIKPVDRPIVHQEVAQQLRICDVIFGCTDDHWGRSILCRLATYYYIPVFDMGVKIDSEQNVIKSIQGRVTILFPGNACLFCRERINSDMISSESLEFANPETARERRKEGYLPELPDTAPSVVSFTSAIAATAVNEFLHKLTGFMGSERKSNEILQLFDQNEIRKNTRLSNEECFCGDNVTIGRGDVKPFLDMRW